MWSLSTTMIDPLKLAGRGDEHLFLGNNTGQCKRNELYLVGITITTTLRKYMQLPLILI